MTCMVYEAAYGEEWKDYLLSNGKMIHIQKDLNDHFCISHWKYVRESDATFKKKETEKQPIIQESTILVSTAVPTIPNGNPLSTKSPKISTSLSPTISKIIPPGNIISSNKDTFERKGIASLKPPGC